MDVLEKYTFAADYIPQVFHIAVNPETQVLPAAQGIPAPNRRKNGDPVTDASFQAFVKAHIKSKEPGAAIHEGFGGPKDSAFVSVFSSSSRTWFEREIAGRFEHVDGQPEQVWSPGLSQEGWQLYSISGRMLTANDAKVLYLPTVMKKLGISDADKWYGEYLIWDQIPKEAVMGSWTWRESSQCKPQNRNGDTMTTR